MSLYWMERYIMSQIKCQTTTTAPKGFFVGNFIVPSSQSQRHHFLQPVSFPYNFLYAQAVPYTTYAESNIELGMPVVFSQNSHTLPCFAMFYLSL